MSAVKTNLNDLKELFEGIPAEGALPDDVQETIEEAEQLIEQLKIQVHSIGDATAKSAALAETRKYIAKLDEVKRRQLMGGSAAAGAGGNGGGQMDAEDERHNNNMARLHAARNQLLESERVAGETLERLNEQEETMKRVNANQKEVIAEQKLSDKLLTRMGKWWRG